MLNWKHIALIEALVIVAFIIFFAFTQSNEPLINEPSESHLISQRIKAGVLSQQSLLIFNFKPLEEDINKYIQENKLNISVYVLNIRDGASLGVDEERRYAAASLNKVPVAMIILKKVEKGDLALDTKLSISEQDRNSASGTLYLNKVEELPIGELLKYLLQESDNTAFNVLAKQVTFKDGRILTEYLNLYQNNLSYDQPISNLELTTKATASLFTSLYLSTFLTAEHSQLVLSYLTNTSYDVKKYADLPDDVTIAQKYGSFYYGHEQMFHSCGIMYIDDSRIFYCIMTQSIEKEKAEKTVGLIVNKIYKYVLEEKNENKYLNL